MGEELDWTTSYCLDEEGFPELLWETLIRFGYTHRPEYRIREYYGVGTQKCEVHLTIFQTPENLDWPPWNIQVIGTRRDDTIQNAARKALLKFCEDHEREIEYSAIRYYPVMDPSRPAWKNRVRKLQGWGQTENDPTLVATVKYLHSLDAYLENRLWEMTDDAMRVGETTARNQALEVQLENARVAATEAERRTNEVIKVLQKERKEHLAEVNKIYKDCENAHGGPRHRRTARKSTFALPWNPRDRTEDLPGLPVLPPEVRNAIETGNYGQGTSSPLEDEQMNGSEEEDPSEREPASEEWEDKEVILEEPEVASNMEIGQGAGGWIEDDA